MRSMHSQVIQAKKVLGSGHDEMAWGSCTPPCATYCQLQRVRNGSQTCSRACTDCGHIEMRSIGIRFMHDSSYHFASDLRHASSALAMPGAIPACAIRQLLKTRDDVASAVDKQRGRFIGETIKHF